MDHDIVDKTQGKNLPFGIQNFAVFSEILLGILHLQNCVFVVKKVPRKDHIEKLEPSEIIFR